MQQIGCIIQRGRQGLTVSQFKWILADKLLISLCLKLGQLELCGQGAEYKIAALYPGQFLFFLFFFNNYKLVQSLNANEQTHTYMKKPTTHKRTVRYHYNS